MNIEDRINLKKQSYYSRLAQKDYIEKSIKDIDEKIKFSKELDIELNKINILLNDASNISRELAKDKLELIVTNALQYAFEKDIKFIVNLDIKRGVPSVDFKIETKINGVKSVKNPIDSNGGGVVDVISTALRYAYLMAIEEDIAKIVILDEPGKMISKGVSIKYAEFIKNLSDSFGIQTIFLTHNESLEYLTDNVIEITNTNNTSKVTQGGVS